MSPDTEPTDEELALVMREAREEAVRKHVLSKAALRQKIDAAIKARPAEQLERLSKRSNARP